MSEPFVEIARRAQAIYDQTGVAPDGNDEVRGRSRKRGTLFWLVAIICAGALLMGGAAKVGG